MNSRIHFIRHGEIERSQSSQHTSFTDLPLSAHGEDEARDLKPRLRHIEFEHVLTSPRLRARRTCELAGLGRAVTVEQDLAEWDYGEYERQRSADIRKMRPGWDIFRDGCPYGETPEQVSTRADRLIAHLRAMDGNIALFSHGQFGCVLAVRWIGLPLNAAQHFLLGTASLSILAYDPNHPEVSVIAMLNAASHEICDPVPRRRDGNALALKRRAIERWENEGGEIPNLQPIQTKP